MVLSHHPSALEGNIIEAKRHSRGLRDNGVVPKQGLNGSQWERHVFGCR